MKLRIAKFAIAALATLAPAALYAQADSIVFGQARVTFTPALMQVFAGVGGTVTDLSLRPLQDGTNLLPITQGVLDGRTSQGEVVFSGGYQITGSGATIRLQDLALDITGPTGGTVSGVFVVNGTILGRQPVFAVIGSFAQTTTAQGQTALVNGLSVGLTPYFVDAINGAVGRPVFTAGTAVGTVNAYAVVVPITTPLN